MARFADAPLLDRGRRYADACHRLEWTPGLGEAHPGSGAFGDAGIPGVDGCGRGVVAGLGRMWGRGSRLPAQMSHPPGPVSSRARTRAAVARAAARDRAAERRGPGAGAAPRRQPMRVGENHLGRAAALSMLIGALAA